MYVTIYMTEISVGFTIVTPGSMDPGMHFGLKVKGLTFTYAYCGNVLVCIVLIFRSRYKKYFILFLLNAFSNIHPLCIYMEIRVIDLIEFQIIAQCPSFHAYSKRYQRSDMNIHFVLQGIN